MMGKESFDQKDVALCKKLSSEFLRTSCFSLNYINWVESAKNKTETNLSMEAFETMVGMRHLS
jgi:hypothetical protein